MSDQALYNAGLAQAHAGAAAKLAQCLAEFSDQPGCCAEYFEAVDKTFDDLCQALGIGEARTVPPIPLYEP